MRFALLFGLLLLPQEDVDALIRQLGDANIEVRGRAVANLAKLGEKARAKLEAAAATGTPEVKARVASILTRLDRDRKQRSWLPPSPRITISGRMTLKEALESVEKQGGPKVQCASWPDGEFSVDLKDVPYWKALEDLCQANGKRTLVCTKSGPMLLGKQRHPLASVLSDVFRLHVSRIADRRGYDFDKGGEDKSFSIFLALGWDAPKAPVRLYVNVESATDDAGNEYAGVIRPNLVFTGHDVILATVEKPIHAVTLDLKSSEAFKPEAKRIARLAGSITAYFRASDENLRVPMPKLTDEWAPAIEVLEEGKADPVVGESTVWVVKRDATGLRCLVKFRNFDSRLVCTFGDIWKVTGEGGSEANGSSDAIAATNPTAPELWLSFRDGSAAVTAVQSLDIALPKRLIRREIPFELKDIPIR